MDPQSTGRADSDVTVSQRLFVALVRWSWQLLQEEPHDRLGCGPLGPESIRSSPYFASIDWGPLTAAGLFSDVGLLETQPLLASSSSGKLPSIPEDWTIVGDL